jgi:thioredoxin-like negative regulator of GroEL
MKVLKFSAEWCNPCQTLKKIIQENDFGVDFTDINVDEDFDSVRKYAVRGFPTLISVDDEGNELKRFVGLMSAQELKEWIGE